MSFWSCTVFILTLLSLFLFEYVISLRISNATYTQRKNAGFLFSMSKTLVSGKNETVCVSLHQAKLPTKILIDLKWKETHFTTLRSVDAEHTCFQMFIPMKNFLDPQFVNIKVQVQINGEIQSAHNQDPILIYPNKLNKVFIETDRGIYKPGDTVKFRILHLNENFLPVPTMVPEIRIKNPMGITIALWDNIQPNHGLINLEHQMVAEAMTGKWKIEVENQTRTFEVSQYVVPRFKIELNYPKVFYYKNDSLTIAVCAKYSFNKPVAGLAFIKVTDSHANMNPVNKLQELSNGCSYFQINNTELNVKKIDEKYRNYDPKIHIFITATVTEHGTNKMNVATGKSQLSIKGYNLKFRNSPIFIPGIPYKGQLRLTNNLTSITGEVIEICFNLAIKKSWNYFNNEQCQNYSVQDNGVISFKLWPFKSSVLHIHLHARSLNHTIIGDSFLIVRMYSPSGSYIHLEKDNNSNQLCNTFYQYKVLYTTDKFQEGDNVTIYYMIKTNMEIFKLRKVVHTVRKNISAFSTDEENYLGRKHKFVKMSTNVDEFFIKFRIERKFVSKSQLLVYYVAKDGETVAVTKSDEIEPCTLKVESSWNQIQLVPGEIATLTIQAKKPALCAVSATDKASKFLTINNQNLNLERILKGVGQERESARSGRNTCILPQKKNQIDTSKLTWDLKRRKRHVYSFSEDYDSYDIFSKFGIITITNLQVVTKHCYNGPLLNDTHQVQFMTDQYSSDNEEGSQVAIRSFFPENWLWELVPVSNSVQLQRELPHCITNWVTNVFCISETEGIGFSPETELSSFQPFFVQVLAPYSLKKGEQTNLPIHVFNYMNYTFPIRISIRLSANLNIAGSNILSASYCLAEHSTVTHTYPLISLEMGAANLTVLVETENQYPLQCGPDTIVSKRDVVYKSIKIESEGYLVTKTNSALLCASSKTLENNITWDLLLPENIVAETEKVAVTINTDLLGRTIENLHQLLTIPTGCGEQIMASMAPNVYILHYLNTTGRLTPSIKQRIIRNLKMGYQRILNYVHLDGSFSAFGYYDQSGSMFLTAFVVKILQEAKNFVYVDQRVVDKAVNWIFSHQLENGCFDTMEHVFQDMGGTNMENSTAGLTAYVILSLFNAKVNVPDAVQTNAKYCIRSQHNPDKYSLIISCYALFRVHWISEGNRFLEKVIALANRENDRMWWSTRGDDEYYASDVEITSYALMALMQQKTAENMAYGHSVVQWLTSKIGPTGGYKSTQDTVVALEALTTYAEYVHTNVLDIKINLEAHQERHMFSIKENDRLKSKQVTLQSKNSEVKMYVTGTGCALAQLTVSYYSTNVSKSEAFKLAVDVTSVSNVNKCSIQSISPCIAYRGPEKLSNMAIMEISLPSGYDADRTSLYELLETGNSKKIKMFEEQENQINFYFTKLDKQEVCFSFNINENSAMETRKDSLVKLYDYYRPEQHILQFYKIINNCSNISIDALENEATTITPPNLNTNEVEESVWELATLSNPESEVALATVNSFE